MSLPLITSRSSKRGNFRESVSTLLGDTTLRVIDGDSEVLSTVPRNSTGEISRFKAYGTKHSH
jgi:hypothetical protein